MRNLTVGVIVVAILLVTVGWAATTHFPVGPAASTLAGSARSTGATDSSVDGLPSTSDSNAGDWLTDSPIIVGQSAKIDFPPDHLALENFTLGVINHDRVGAGLSPVVVSSVLSGQQHADSMAYYGYFSHWDNQGYKPYMRYTLLGVDRERGGERRPQLLQRLDQRDGRAPPPPAPSRRWRTR